MRGIVFNLLEQVVSADRGEAAWDALLRETGLDGSYTALAWYPDDEFETLIKAAASSFDLGFEEFQRWLGRRAIPFMAERYPQIFAAHASTRPLLLDLDHLIPDAVRARYPGAEIPLAEISLRTNGDGVTIEYSSARRLCMLAEGLVEGVADHFGEIASITQTACMLRGDPSCQLVSRFDKRETIGIVVDGNGSLLRSYEDPPSTSVAPVDFERRWIRERNARLRAEAIADKALRRLYGIVDELHQSNEELREREARFSAGVGASPDAVVSADAQGTIWYFNRSARRMFGYERDEIRGRPLTVLMPERYRQPHLEGFRRFLATGEARVLGRTVELEGLRKDGSEFPVEISLATWDTRKGPFFVTVIRDITERKRMELELVQRTQELARSNEELEQFASVASHDLQEPLRMVASYVELLAKRYADKLDAEAEEFIGYALDGVTRMKRLINDLLTLSRLGTRGRPFEPTESAAALDHALANLRVTCEETGAIVTRGELPMIMADSAQLTQLFQNLIGNAIKFRSSRTPEVHVDAQERNGEWLFWVRDNGIGMEPQYLDRIFVVFQRLHTRDEYPGTGIGLALAKKIVERHGGRLWAESDLGAGATFFFTIPVVPAT